MGLRETILGATDLKRERVHLPSLGVDVWVRTLTLGEDNAFQSERIGLDDDKRLDSFMSRLMVRTVCDESGAAVFTAADIGALDCVAAPELKRLYDVAARLNRYSKADAEELEKNSGGGPSAA